MKVKKLIESHVTVQAITEFTKLKRLSSIYKKGIPNRPQNLKKGALLVTADDSDSDYNYERYLIIKNNPSKKFLIIYDQDEDRIKAIDNPQMKYVLGYTQDAPYLDKATEISNTFVAQIKRVETDYKSYLVQFSKKDRHFFFT